MSKSKRIHMSTPVVNTTLTFKLPAAFTKQGEGLLDQQMWCWGCDVRRKAGNLLLAYGFAQRPSPDRQHHSAYTYRLGADCAITLWGWGVWFASCGEGSLFLSRSGFKVRYTTTVDLCPSCWWLDDLPPLHPPTDSTAQHHTLHLLKSALIWIADYERWLASATPADYREHAINTWPMRRKYRGGVPANVIISAWESLANSL